ncbi:hypothetical protein CWO89_33905 [Bradyrhizobium sp. Leo170]|nr:hypothetical protein CWO89_33905 [Bradyrhizobium sp. Leo170]
MVVESLETEQKGALIAKLLGDAKLPAIFSFTESVGAGGLMAYSFDLIELYKRSAHTLSTQFSGEQSPATFRFTK